MIDYIIYPNPRIGQELLFESIQWYNEERNIPILLRILDVETEKVMFGNDYIIKLYFEIRTFNFTCKAYGYNNGQIDKTKTEIVKAANETVMVKYVVEGNDYKYKIERNDPLFDLVNYALQCRELVYRGNTQGLNNIDTLVMENALKGLDFKAIIEENENGQLILSAWPTDKTKVNLEEE